MRQSRITDRANAWLEGDSALREYGTIPVLGAALALLILAPPSNTFGDWTVVLPAGVILVFGSALARGVLTVAVVLAGGFLVSALKLSRRGWFITIGVAVAGWAVAVWW